MKIFIVALLLAIGYAQTAGETGGVTGAKPRGQQAIKLADATGANIDNAASVEATKNWLKEKQTQMKFLDELQKQADTLSATVKSITQQRPLYASATDRKNQADSALEEESVNYLAAELVRLKKKVDQAITERDSIVDKYVPELKAAMKKREEGITKYWEGKQTDWKQEMEDLHSNIAKLKEAQQKEISDKDAELESQRQQAQEELQRANDEAEKGMNQLREESKTAQQKSADKLAEVSKEAVEREERYKAQLAEAHDKNTKQYQDSQAEIANVNKRNEEQIRSISGKYEGEVQAVQAKLSKAQEENKVTIEKLTEEKQNLQKQVIQADAKKTQEIANLKKRQSDRRKKDREASSKKEAALIAKLNKEKTDALKAAADASQRTLENANAQAEQRIQNIRESQQNERDRNKATVARLKEQIKQEQDRTDSANKQLRSVQTQLDDLKTNMATISTANAGAISSSSSSSLNPGTTAQDLEVAASNSETGLNLTAVGFLVALNVALVLSALMYYFESKKTRNVYDAGLLEEF